MNKAESEKLIDRYLKGDCTPEEKLLLERFYLEESTRRKLSASEIDAEGRKAEIWEATQKEIIRTTYKPAHTLRLLLAAASVLLVLSVSFWFYSERTKGKLPAIKTVKNTEKSIPASGKALLTLADGTTIALDNAADGMLSSQAGNRVVKAGNGNIIYQDGKGEPASKNKITYNTLTIPCGSLYHLTLSDGSSVWLNSASSITFPVSFPGNERIVTITGEAYFEIAGNRNKPFLVRSGDQIIRVLGTHFNVMAYNNDAAVITTLLEGSVKIIKNKTEILLKPGQAVSISNISNSVKVTSVNTDDAIAWRQGYFKFDNEGLESIMNKISRWYDTDIEFKDDVKDKRFWGTYSRSKGLTDLLNDLEQTDDVHFKVDGRRIIVMK